MTSVDCREVEIKVSGSLALLGSFRITALRGTADVFGFRIQPGADATAVFHSIPFHGGILRITCPHTLNASVPPHPFFFFFSRFFFFFLFPDSVKWL
jgi:hypothetical protein